jgi:hypothetical protein
MVFTAGQMLGIVAFTAAVLAIGALLLKLDTMIGTNHDTAGDAGGDAAPTPPVPTSAKPPTRVTPQRRRHH